MRARQPTRRKLTITARIAALSIVWAGCGAAASVSSSPGSTNSSGTTGSASTAAPRGTDSRLTLGSPKGVAVIDPASGTAITSAPTAVPSGDGTRWMTSAVNATAADTKTRVGVFDPVSRTEQSATTVDGQWKARVASTDGGAVALSANAKSAPGYLALPRLRTELMVLRPPAPTPQLLELDGNFEPEAFSVDTKALFVLQFTPAEAPNRYRVRRLDLDTGIVGVVLDRTKAPQTDMPGQARVQVRAPDGSALYTLYTVDAGHGHHEGPHAFVHVLDLKDQFAHCIDLPKPFGAAAQEVAALAVSPDGSSLFAVDRAAGAVASIDLKELTVRASAPIRPVPTAQSVTAAVGTADRLFIGTDAELTTIDTRDLRETGSNRLTEPATALYQSPVSGRLYVAARVLVMIYDDEKKYLRNITVASMDPIVSIGPGAGPLPAQRDAFECAC